MGRPLRAAQGGLVYHTLNRANARLTIFEDDGDFAALERSGRTTRIVIDRSYTYIGRCGNESRRPP
jgi:hypothetical protein